MSLPRLIPQMITLKIAEYYPNRVGIIPLIDDKTLGFSAAIVVMERDGSMGDTLYAYDDYRYASRYSALAAMDRSILQAMEAVRVMSN